MAEAVMIARAMRTARTVSSASGADDRKLKLIAGGRRESQHHHASLARRTLNLPLSIVKIRFWVRGRFVVAAFRGDLKKMLSLRGDRGFESIFLQR
jgi:hypothetical protein